MIKPGDVIKHEKFMDVCFMLSRVFKGKKGIKVSGVWMNMGYTRSWFIEDGSFEIKMEDLQSWLICTDEKVNPCLRYCPWEKVSL